MMAASVQCTCFELLCPHAHPGRKLSPLHRERLATRLAALTMTENGAPAHATTDASLVDLFFALVRQASPQKLTPLVAAAFRAEPLLVAKMWLQTRAIVRAKGKSTGKGEKQLFHVLAGLLHALDPRVVLHNLRHIPFYGCWKDLLELAVQHPVFKPAVVQLFAEQLQHDAKKKRTTAADGKAATPAAAAPSVSLAAKWAPSEGKHYDKAPHKLAKAVREELKLSPREYRQLLTQLRSPELLETKLCAKAELAAEDYSSFPSQAMKFYQKSLKRKERHPHFPEYLERLKVQRTGAAMDVTEDGEEQQQVKMNVATLLPHQILTGLGRGLDDMCEEQWRAYVAECATKGEFQNMLPVVDVSGSMSGTPMDVAVALGLLCASLVDGPYRNQMVTFSARPEYHLVDAAQTLAEQVQHIKSMDWGMNTNIHAVFEMLLHTAVEHKVPELPTLVIFSDMQFDEACGHEAKTNDDAMRALFAQHGYPVPRVVYWNLRGDTQTNFPLKAQCENVQMLSGFSPSLLKMVGRDELAKPLDTILAILQDPHFDRVTLPPSVAAP